MTHRHPADNVPRGPDKREDVVNTCSNTELAVASDATVVIPGETATANQLTDEEQMALFEKELKENDWGHQPC